MVLIRPVHNKNSPATVKRDGGVFYADESTYWAVEVGVALSLVP